MIIGAAVSLICLLVIILLLIWCCGRLCVKKNEGKDGAVSDQEYDAGDPNYVRGRSRHGRNLSGDRQSREALGQSRRSNDPDMVRGDRRIEQGSMSQSTVVNSNVKPVADSGYIADLEQN